MRRSLTTAPLVLLALLTLFATEAHGGWNLLARLRKQPAPSQPVTAANSSWGQVESFINQASNLRAADRRYLISTLRPAFHRQGQTPSVRFLGEQPGQRGSCAMVIGTAARPIKLPASGGRCRAIGDLLQHALNKVRGTQQNLKGFATAASLLQRRGSPYLGEVTVVDAGRAGQMSAEGERKVWRLGGRPFFGDRQAKAYVYTKVHSDAWFGDLKCQDVMVAGSNQAQTMIFSPHNTEACVTSVDGQTRLTRFPPAR